MMEVLHISPEVLNRLARRELTPREIAELMRHLDACPECARTSAAAVEAQLGALQSPIDGDEGPWHPEFRDMAAFADGTAGPAEREIVSSHLEDCAICREDVGDLMKLRRSRSRRIAWRAALATAAVIAAVVVAVILLRAGANKPQRMEETPVVMTETPTAITAAPEIPAPTPAPKYANAEWDRLVRTAVESQLLIIARGIDASPDVLRGIHDHATPELAPSGIVIDETRPRFSWPVRDGAAYVVSIFRDDQRIAESEPLTGTHWTPSASLTRGRTYVWQVQVTRGAEGDSTREIIPAPPAPPAMFHIISKRDHDELTEARRLHPDDHLLHAVLAARAGLRKEAVAALGRAGTKIRVVPQD